MKGMKKAMEEVAVGGGGGGRDGEEGVGVCVEEAVDP